MPGNTWTHFPKLRASDPTRRCHGRRSCGEDLVLEDQGFVVGVVRIILKYLVTIRGSQVQYSFCLSENFLTNLWRAGDASKEVVVEALLPKGEAIFFHLSQSRQPTQSLQQVWFLVLSLGRQRITGLQGMITVV